MDKRKATDPTAGVVTRVVAAVMASSTEAMLRAAVDACDHASHYPRGGGCSF